ncbi:2738_t:CDS:10, partial [Ambispora gerdemannii]
MMQFVDQTLDVFRKYRKTEPPYLVALRCCTITICVLLIIIYGIFLLLFLINDDPVERSVVVPAPTIPAADGTRSEQDLCTSLIIPPKCCCDANNSTDHFTGYFTAWKNGPNGDSSYTLNYDLTSELYGVWYTIRKADSSYNPQRDQGMIVRAFDSEFNPQTLPNYPNDTSQNIDSDFYNSIDELNHHVIGYRQNNWMFVNRHLKKKLRPGAGNVIGIPPRHFNEYYLTTEYESVNNPANAQNLNQDNDVYANLFVGTLNWYEEEITERRSRSLLDCFGLLAGFYALIAGIYICCFGAAAILPWGCCQIIFLRKQIRDDLRNEYPNGIPLIDTPNPEVSCKERLNYLEKFMRQYVIDVDYLRDYESDDDDDENEKIGATIDAAGGSGPSAGSVLPIFSGRRKRKNSSPNDGGPNSNNNVNTPGSPSDNSYTTVPPSGPEHEVGGPGYTTVPARHQPSTGAGQSNLPSSQHDAVTAAAVGSGYGTSGNNNSSNKFSAIGAGAAAGILAGAAFGSHDSKKTTTGGGSTTEHEPATATTTSSSGYGSGYGTSGDNNNSNKFSAIDASATGVGGAALGSHDSKKTITGGGTTEHESTTTTTTSSNNNKLTAIGAGIIGGVAGIFGSKFASHDSKKTTTGGEGGAAVIGGGGASGYDSNMAYIAGASGGSSAIGGGSESIYSSTTTTGGGPTEIGGESNKSSSTSYGGLAIAGAAAAAGAIGGAAIASKSSKSSSGTAGATTLSGGGGSVHETTTYTTSSGTTGGEVGGTYTTSSSSSATSQASQVALLASMSEQERIKYLATLSLTERRELEALLKKNTTTKRTIIEGGGYTTTTSSSSATSQASQVALLASM